MTEPTAALLALRASTADLVRGLANEGWSDDDVRAPSLCAGWTRGHVLTHLARNADGIAATLAGALRDEVVARYPGGDEERNRAIDAGASRTMRALQADVAESAERLDRVMGAVGDADGWARGTERGLTAQHWLVRRMREVEIHRIDLAGSYTPDRWPPLLITEVLPVAASMLANRTDEAVRVEVQAHASIVAELVGSVWQNGDGAGVDVCGPDWAVLAWLLGRGRTAAHALTATPELRPWR